MSTETLRLPQPSFPGVCPTLALLAALSVLSGCSLRTMAINTMADTLAASGDVYASDDDPELVRDALPFSLKTIESLLDASPRHAGLLLTACSGFTSYSYAFVEIDAELLEGIDEAQVDELRDRALRLYLRGQGYCLRALELRQPGITGRMLRDPEGALAFARREDVPLLYWSGASWGGAIALGLHRPDLIADLPVVRALMTRALELDEAWDRGAIHGVLIALEAAAPGVEGGFDRARRHFERAVALSRGLSASPYVTLARSVAVPEQDRAEFERLLHAALAVDPDEEESLRLMNILTQRRAKRLLERGDDLFLDAANDTPLAGTHGGRENR
jgi:predicted anti-sigma-YlaC factor YlaD